MARKLTPATPGTDIQVVDKTPPEMAAVEIAWRAADAEAVARATGVAKELQYDEELSFGALEDGFRLYQRSAVEDFLELGKRLLLLKELTPHGEFGQRIERLGFSDRSARKFMQAAAKAAKSANLAVLSGRVKNPSVFVELIALDDDTLYEFADIDDSESLTAPEAKRRVRELQSALNKATADHQGAVASATAAAAEIKRLQLTLPQREPDETVRDMMRELAGRVRDVQANTAALLDGVQAITQHADENELGCDEDVGTYVLNAIRPVIGLIADLRNLRGIDAPARFALEILARPGAED